jgi:hypothetical protein
VEFVKPLALPRRDLALAGPTRTNLAAPRRRVPQCKAALREEMRRCYAYVGSDKLVSADAQKDCQQGRNERDPEEVYTKLRLSRSLRSNANGEVLCLGGPVRMSGLFQHP